MRAFAKGDERLLAGKLVGLFDVRRQQWKALRLLESVRQQGPVSAIPLLEPVPRGALLLFDLGYFSFPWLDYLTQRGYFYICRLRESTRYQIVHIYYQQGDTLDALVWLGGPSGNRAACLVRLVRFHDGERIRSYLSNVSQAWQLSLPDMARRDGRR